MEVQIFGVRKSSDTRKALRFFSERRIKTHFVDLNERPASVGELQRFAQRFGVESLVDPQSSRYAELGLRHARKTEAGWFELLIQEPKLLVMPLIRSGKHLGVGLAEDLWRAWIQQEHDG
jgi:arsenate reductase-like glutaredoxin family protein